LPFNSGLSAGRNAIIREVKEDYVLLSDDDLMLSNPDSVKAMKEVLDSRDDIGICAGVVRLENGEHFGGKGYSRGLRFEMRGGALFRHPSNGSADKVNGIRFNY
ncbi:MAG: glycosyltransferase, partial [Candidatus Aenigmarchaeota archaeon]|nr:glycosyltransferase [Candidatus Aenigmarchaeota archaeon]